MHCSRLAAERVLVCMPTNAAQPQATHFTCYLNPEHARIGTAFDIVAPLRFRNNLPLPIFVATVAPSATGAPREYLGADGEGAGVRMKTSWVISLPAQA